MNTKDNEVYSDDWISYDDSKVYEDYRLKKSDNAKYHNSQRPRLELHNNIDANYQKVLGTIKFMLGSALGKFSKSGKWKIEVWVDNRKTKKFRDNEIVSCGIALKRPGASVLYAKKAAGSLSRAVSRSLEVIEEAVKLDKKRWKVAKQRVRS